MQIPKGTTLRTYELSVYNRETGFVKTKVNRSTLRKWLEGAISKWF